MTLMADAAPRGYPWRRVGYGLRRLATVFRSSVCRGVPAARVPKLIFDPLEPRLLLNADAHALTLDLNTLPVISPTHAVVVQLVDEVASANSQAAAVPQIEI